MGLEKRKRMTHKFLWDFGASAGADSSAATGTIPIFSAPANCVIHAVRANVATAVTGSTAEEVGDGTDVDGYLVDNFAASTGLSPTSVNDADCGAFMFVPGTTDAADRAPEEKMYAAADTIDYLITGTATAGKIYFEVEYSVLS